VAQRTRQAGPSEKADATNGSLQGGVRRGMLVMPAELEWIVKRGAADPTSGSLQEAARISIVSRAENLTTAKLQMHPTARVRTSQRFVCGPVAGIDSAIRQVRSSSSAFIRF